MKIVRTLGIAIHLKDEIKKKNAYNDILGVFNPNIPIPGLEWVSVFVSLDWVGFLALNRANEKV
jgi:hypothetical protein